MSLDCGKYRERSHAGKGRTCKFETERPASGFKPGLCRCDHCTALLGSIHRLKSLYLIYLCQIQIKISLEKMYQVVCVGGLLQLQIEVRRYHMFQKVKSE